MPKPERLLNNGFRYWFDDVEIEELHRGNAAFHVQTIEYEMLLKGFEKPPAHAVTDCFMTTVEILDYLRSYSSLNLSEKRMGEALRKAGFERRSKRIERKSRLRLGHREDHTQSFRLLRIVVTTLLHTATKY